MMAFTFLVLALTAVASIHAQPLGFPGAGTFQSLIGVGPNAGRLPQPTNLATCRMQNQAGDVLQLTLTEGQPGFGGGNPFSPFGGPGFGGPGGQFGGPFSGIFGAGGPGLLGGGGLVRVVGTLIKTGTSGTFGGGTGTGSLNGLFKLVVTVNGNTAAQCVGMGPPLGVPAATQPQTPLSPFGQTINPFGGSSLFGNPFNSFGGLPQINQPGSTVPLVLDTDVRADTVSSTVQGNLYGVSLQDLFGRGMQVCADPGCSRKTDMCCSVVRDSMSVDDFERALQHQLLLQQASGGGGTLTGLSNPTDGLL